MMLLNSAISGFIVALFLVGCAVTPLPKTGSAVVALSPDEALRSGQMGVRVRWGGIIIQTSPEPAQTCFEISSRPLDEEGEPLQTDRTFGRFMACAKGFYEPSVYAASRRLTVVGELAPVVVGKLGEHEYRYPMVQVEASHLWPVAVAQPASPPLYFYDPFWDFRFPFYYPAPYPFPFPFRYR